MLSQTAHDLDLGFLPKDMELPFDDFEGFSDTDCFQSDEGRVASECPEYDTNQVKNVDHDYEGTEYAQSHTDNEFICSPSSPTKEDDEEQVNEPAASRPRRNAVRQRYVSEASDNSSNATPVARRSKISEHDSKKSSKTISKNAIAARENRQKKKDFINRMKSTLDKAEAENKKLKNANLALTRNNEALINEVSYLRGVLANVPEISALIRSVQSTSGIKEVTTSFGGSSKQNMGAGKRKFQDENADEAARKSARLSLKKDSTHSAGVCLHVANGIASLEFCQMCSSRAKKGLHK